MRDMCTRFVFRLIVASAGWADAHGFEDFESLDEVTTLGVS